MGRFSGKSSATAKANRDFVRINPYEIPEMALTVIANICSKNNTDDANPIFIAIKTELLKKGKDELDFYEFINKYRKDLFNFDFLTDIRKQMSEIVQELLAHENTNDTQVVVAGGFSAGKSSFLNALTGCGELLPTGIAPCSMVQTYLYCSAKTHEIVVKGINLKDAVVLLDKNILQSIQHESKSKVYLASVLDKLFVEVPSTTLDGFVFIDTPGYNNSDQKSVTNNRTDEEVAKDAINRGNVLLWVIDAGGGTIPKKDMDMIREFVQGSEDRKIAVIFNKADKKGEQEIVKIVNEAYPMLADMSDAVIDVLGYSSQENKIYYSYKGYDMPKLLQELRQSGNGNSGVIRRVDALMELFDDEIHFAGMARSADELEKKKLISRKNESYKRLQKETDGTKEYVQKISDIMVKGYDDLLSLVRNLSTAGINAFDVWSQGLNSIYKDECSKTMNHGSVIGKIINNMNKSSQLAERFDKLCDFSSIRKEYREEWLERIKVKLERYNEDVLNVQYQNIEDCIESKNTDIEKYRSIASELKKYRDIVKSTLSYKIKEFRSSAHQVQDARIDFSQVSDIFTAIRTGSYSEFLKCFIVGVKLSDTNPEGYTPMTYSVKMNRYDMLKFLMTNGGRPDALDSRGMNAYLTAVENANEAFINYLLKIDPSLKDYCSDKGKTAYMIAEQNFLGEWYKTKIKL